MDDSGPTRGEGNVEGSLREVNPGMPENNVLYKTIFEISPDAICIMDSAGRILRANQAAADMHGFSSSSEMSGMNALDLIAPEDRDRAVSSMAHSLEAGGIRNVQYRFLRCDGSTFHGELNVNVVQSEDGGPVLRIGIMRNTDERVRSRQTLQQSEQEKALVLGSLKELVVFQDLHHHIIWTNRAAVDSVDSTPESLIGKRCHEVWHESDSPCDNCPVTEVIQSGRAQAGEIQSPDGRSWLIHGNPVFNDEGRLSGVVEVTLDITDRVKAEKALAESEERFRQVAENAREWIWETDEDGLFTYSSQIVENILGYRVKELTGRMYLFDLLRHDERSALTQDIGNAFANRETIRDFVIRSICRKGSEVWLSMTAWPIQDPEDRLKGYRGVGVDITPQKTAYEALTESQALYRTLIDTSPDAIIVSNTEATITMANQRAVEMLRLESPEDLIGTDSFANIAPEERERAYENAYRTFEDGAIELAQYEVVRADGSRFTAEFNVSMLWDVDGVPSGFMAVVRDISDRKQIEEALRDSEDRFNTMIQESDYGYSELDFDGNITFSNQRAADMCGYSLEELIGLNVAKLVVPEELERTFHEFQEVLSKPNEGPREHRIRTRNGEIRWLEVNALPLRKRGEIIGFQCTLLDITGRKIAEQALHDSEEKFNTMVKESDHGYVEMDLEGTVTFLNRKAEELYGGSGSEIIGRNALDVLCEEEIPRAREDLAKVLHEPNAGPREYAAKNRNGEIRYLEVNTLPLRKGGRPIGFQATLRDVTDRKKAEQALRESEAKYSAVVRQAHDGVAIVQDGFIELINPALERMTGYSIRETEGRPFLDYIAPEDRDEVGRNYKRRLAGEDAPSVYQAGLIRKDGFTIVTEFSAGLINYGGRPAIVTILRDVTERIQIEDALRESEAKYSALVEQASDAVVILQDGIVKFANSAAARNCGKTVEELLETDFTELVPPEDQQKIAERHQRRMQGESVPSVFELRLLRSDGSQRNFEVSATVITYRGRPAVLAIGRDMTERRLLEEELAKAQRIESLGVLAGGLAHDFNNILTAVLGNISLAMLHAGTDNVVHSKLDEASRAINRAKALTQQLLTFSRGGAPVRKSMAVDSLVKDTVEFALSGSNVTAAFNIAEDLWPVVADEGQITQVFNNLALNAVQAMPEGGTLTVDAVNLNKSHSSRLPLDQGRYVSVSLTDEGIGIPAEHKRKVFDPYFTTKQNGSGLGLATAYSIMLRHGGHISAHSSPEGGATFTVYLPAGKEEPSSSKKAEYEIVRGSGRILLMDDEELVRRIAGEMLQYLGYEVLLTENGEQALKAFSSAHNDGNPYDAIILDLTVPGGMGGQDTLKHMQKIQPGVKALVSSGYSNNPVMAEHEKYGFAAVVTKPYRISELAAALKEVLT